MPPAAPSVLVVEDHPHVARSVERGLTEDGHRVTVVMAGNEGLAEATRGTYDAIVLDLLLPEVNGLDILAAIRRRSLGTPVLLLTARDTLQDRLDGFDLGADDYLVKPFALPELRARVRALLQRTRPASSTVLRVADIEIDLISRRCQRAGRPVDLAPKEFELLAYLIAHRGRVVTREMLGQHVWNALARGTPLDNVIDVHVGRLRRKLDPDTPHRLIRTVRGLGFLLSDDARS